MKFFYLSLIAIFLSCSISPSQSKESPLSTSSCSLPDSLFALKNISNSLVAEHFYYDTNNSCYADSSKRIKLTLLDDTQKRQYIDSIPPYGREWIIGDWQMYFVSKQNKIDSFTPIIVSAGGTDFSALILVLLDTSCHPVSHFILSGGECGVDPIECDFKQSFLNGKQIKSYVRTIVDKENLYDSDSLLVDSVNFVTEILPDGSLETKKVDSSRYKRKFFIK